MSHLFCQRRKTKTIGIWYLNGRCTFIVCHHKKMTKSTFVHSISEHHHKYFCSHWKTCPKYALGAAHSDWDIDSWNPSRQKMSPKITSSSSFHFVFLFLVLGLVENNINIDRVYLMTFRDIRAQSSTIPKIFEKVMRISHSEIFKISRQLHSSTTVYK